MARHQPDIGEESGQLFERNLRPTDKLAFIPNETWTHIIGDSEPSTKPPKREIPYLQQAKTKKLAQTGQLIDQLKANQDIETPENAMEIAAMISEKVGHTVTAADVIEAGLTACVETLLAGESFHPAPPNNGITFESASTGRNLGGDEEPYVENIVEAASGLVSTQETIGTRKEAVAQTRHGADKKDNDFARFGRDRKDPGRIQREWMGRQRHKAKHQHERQERI